MPDAPPTPPPKTMKPPTDPHAVPPFAFELVLAQEHEAIRGLRGDAPPDPQRPFIALCLSGGGIRSATFALGVIQNLAQKKLMPQFDYLSTVSGGGYIGSWLSALIQRDGGRAEPVFGRLATRPDPFPGLHRHTAAAQAPAVGTAATPPPPPTATVPDPTAEAREVHWLRSYSRFMTPRAGLLSADTWTLVATVLRNLTLNWLLFLPLLLLALLPPRFLFTLITWPVANGDAPLASEFALWASLAGAFLSGAAALGYIRGSHPSRSWCKRGQEDFLVHFLVPMMLSSLLLTLYWAWYRLMTPAPASLVGFLLFGLLFNLSRYLPGLTQFELGRPPGEPAIAAPPRPPAIRPSEKSVFREVLTVAGTGLLSGSLLWVAATSLFPRPQDHPALYAAFAAPLLGLIFVFCQTLYVGLLTKYSGEDDREAWARASGWMWILILGGVAYLGLVLFGPHGFSLLHDWAKGAAAVAGGMGGILSAWLGFSTHTAAKPPTSHNQDWGAAILGAIAKIGAAVFIVVLLTGIVLLTDRVLSSMFSLLPSGLAIPLGSPWTVGWHQEILRQTTLPLLLGLAATLVLVLFLLSPALGVNQYSLNSMYGSRLVRAYLGASNRNRKPLPFIGLCPDDNLPMCALRRQRPLHVLNTTLNLVGGGDLAWQDRKAAPFTISPFAAGSRKLGYRPSDSYAGKDDGISLGKALAISGAAASPNMGFNSSPLLTLLMTLFNARLGWWLGNPKSGPETWKSSNPSNGMLLLAKEALGMTTADADWVLLSDGAHFENLAVYEMLARGCSELLVVDSGCESADSFQFEDLANLTQKARVDLGVSIRFDKLQLEKDPAKPGKRCALARLHRDDLGDYGRLLYVKPCLRNNEPRDVLAYAAQHPAFPHESTADQWFSEAQFESYRRLGWQTVEEICPDWSEGDTFTQFLDKVQVHLGAP